MVLQPHFHGRIGRDDVGVMPGGLGQMAGSAGVMRYFREAPVVAGLTAGVLVMYVTGLIVG